MAALLCLSACGRYLDVQPQGKVLPKTDEEFAAIIYNTINEIEGGGDEFVIGNMDVILYREGCADDLDANISLGKTLPAYAGDEINKRQSRWRDSFEIVRDCNIVIENLSGRNTKEALGILSASYAIKGIVYYNLMREFCQSYDKATAAEQLGLPFVDKFDIYDFPTRSDLRSTGEYIEDLLQKSIAFKNEDGKYFFTEYIVKAYLARVLFWEQKWDELIPLCKDIISNGGWSLTERAEYASVVNAPSERKGEVIVRSHINNASELDWYFSYTKGYIASRPASKAFVSLFGEEPSSDVRYGVCLDSKRYNAKTPECRVRLSEIVLMLSEAYCHKGSNEEALYWLNLLRSKRILNVEDYTLETLPAVREGSRIAVDCSGKALTPLMQAIFDERRKELFMEGDRWYELKRNGCPEWWIISNGLKYTTKKYLYTAPIYKADIDLNPLLEQNEGYL